MRGGGGSGPGDGGGIVLRVGRGHDEDEQVDVCPAGDLGHDAAVGRVEVDLAADDRGEHRSATFDDRRGGLVAGGLDAEDPAPLESLAHDRPSVTVAPGKASSMAARRSAYSGVSTSLAHMTIASRSEEHTSELQSLMRISYALFCL